MRTEEPRPVRLKDYRPPDWLIDTVHLDVSLHPTAATVRAKLKIKPNPAGAPAPLVLDGDELKLSSLALDGKPLPAENFVATPDKLTIAQPPNRPFELEIETEVDPTGNTQLMGLYRAGAAQGGQGRVPAQPIRVGSGSDPELGHPAMRRQVPDIFRKQVDLDPRVGAVGEVVAFAAAMHRPVVVRLRHIGEHQRVNIVGKNVLEHQMRERCVRRSRGIDRTDDECAQAVDREPAVARFQIKRLIHRTPAPRLE